MNVGWDWNKEKLKRYTWNSNNVSVEISKRRNFPDIGEAWGQVPDEEDDAEDEDTFMARQVQIFEADEAEHEAVEWLATNPTRYELEDSRSLVDVDRTVDLFKLADHK